VKPPRFKGEKRGIFGSRTPHWMNNIGLSIVKIERIEYKSILISGNYDWSIWLGLDLIDNTPILDIKPFHSSDIPS